MIEDLISVIVPVYNVEKYLPDLFKSLDSQINKNFEVIFVNDCSTDNSKSLIQKYMENHPNCKLVNHQTNMGVSATRNTGMLHVEGEYFTFVDPDDFISPYLFQMYIDVLKTTNVDFVSSNFKEIDDSTRYEDIHFKKSKHKNAKILISREMIFKFMNVWKGPINHLIWNKCFKTEIYKKLDTFPKMANDEINLGDDIYIFANLLVKCKRAAILNTKYYYYRVRSGSICNSKFEHSKINTVYALLPFIKLFDDDVQWEEHIKALMTVYAVKAFNQMRRDNYSNVDDFAKVFTTIKDCIKYCWKWKTNNPGYRLMPLLYPMYFFQFKRYLKKINK